MEIVVYGNEAEEMPEVDTQPDSETDVWRYHDSDSDNFDAAANKTTCESQYVGES